MQTLQSGNRSLHMKSVWSPVVKSMCIACWMMATWLLLAPSAQALASPLSTQEIIELPAESRWLTPYFEEVYRLGTPSGADWEQFGSVDVAFDGAGRLYVLDHHVDSIFVVGREGEYLRALGGPGEGPGEFRNVVEFAVLRDGSVVVADFAYPSYQVFDANGQFQRMVEWAPRVVWAVSTGLMPDPRGGAVFVAVGSPAQAFEMVNRGGVTPSPTTRPIERLNITGDVVVRDTVGIGWLPEDSDPMAIGVSRFNMVWRRSDGRSAVAKAFPPLMLAGVLPDGSVAFSDSLAYAIKIARPGSGVWRILKRPLEPIPVTRRVRAAERERRLRMAEERSQVVSRKTRERIASPSSSGTSWMCRRWWYGSWWGPEQGSVLTAVMQTLQFGNQGLHVGGWALLASLLFTPSGHAQEVIHLPAGDRWLEPDIEEVYRVGTAVTSAPGDRPAGVPHRTIRHSRIGNHLGQAHLGTSTRRGSLR